MMIRDENFPPFFALEALRRDGEDLLVWADALSIDQQDSEEKNDQPSLMADVYKKARLVAGPEENDSHIATAFPQDLVAGADTGADPIKIKKLLTSRTQDESLPTLAALFERYYWNRLCVVQEIFNAATVYVFCGLSEPLPWNDY